MTGWPRCTTFSFIVTFCMIDESLITNERFPQLTIELSWYLPPSGASDSDTRTRSARLGQSLLDIGSLVFMIYASASDEPTRANSQSSPSLDAIQFHTRHATDDQGSIDSYMQAEENTLA
jgi:hypothetical protein